MSGEWPPKPFVPPPSYREIGPNAGSAESAQIIDNASDRVNSFLHAQRQQVAQSTLDYHKANISAPDLDIYYTNQLGAEKIEFDTHPVEAAVADAVEAQGVDPIYDTPPYPSFPAPDQPTTGFTIMVLFGTDGIAAFDGVTSTKLGQNLYLDTSNGSDWGKVISPVGQYKLGGTGWILTPLNLSGDPKAKSSNLMRLSTTKLTDGVETQASSQAIPVMNGGSQNAPIYTPGGAYAFDKQGKLVQGQAMELDGSVPVQPTAIDTDGSSYFFPAVVGEDITVKLDPKSLLSGYGFSGSYSTDNYNKQQKLISSIPYPQVATVSKLVTVTSSDDNSHVTTETTSGECVIVTYGTLLAVAWANGASSYGAGAFGQIPTAQNVKISQSTRQYELFDIGQNHTTIQTVAAAGDDFSNSFPLQVYTYDKSATNDKVTVGMFPISAISDTTRTLTLGTNKHAFTIIGSSFGVTGSTQVNSDAFDSQVTEVQAGQTYADGVTYPARPPNPATAAEVDDYYSQCKAAMTAVPHLLSGPVTVSDVPLVVTNSPTGQTITGQYNSPDDAPFPNDTSFAYGGPGKEGASSYNHPYSCGSTSGDLIRFTQVKALGRSLTYDYTEPGNNSTTPATTAQAPYIHVHAFPPALGSGATAQTFFTSYETSESGSMTCAVFTPYGSFQQTGAPAEPYDYWVHASNGAHVLQGFLINGTPHVYVDGGTTDLAQQIATACKCQLADLRAIFVDIDLGTVKEVADVPAPIYSNAVSSGA